MDDNTNFSLNEETFHKLLKIKKNGGFEKNTWDEWFNQVFDDVGIQVTREKTLEKIANRYYEKDFEKWVQSFALNLNDIWKESSARELDPTSNNEKKENSDISIVIGKGPSLKKYHHLELLSNSSFKGSVICSDGVLIDALKAGVTPEKFPNFFVVTIDPHEKIEKYYDDDLVDKFGYMIRGIFSTVTYPSVSARARKAGIKLHWLHALFDYEEGKKSFNQISALMVRARNHTKGLPAIQTGGNVGTACWFVSWQILKCKLYQ